MTKPSTPAPARPPFRSLRGATALAAATTAVLLTGCGTGDAEAVGGSAGDGPLKVGVLFPGSLSDDGFMNSAYRGYQRAAEAHGDKIALGKVEQVAPADFEKALVRFASTSDLVISLGGQTDADVRKVAPRFPKVKFVEVGGPADGKPLANLALYDPRQAEAAYLSGAAAALISEKRTVGFVGGAELPAIVNAAVEFGNGAKAAVPGVKVLTPQYVGDFNDVAKAKQSALADYSAGADVLGQNLNLGKKGMAQAATRTEGRLIGGPVAHPCGTDPAYAGYVTSDIGAEIEYAVEQALERTWKAENVTFGFGGAKPASALTLCDVDPAVQQKLEAVAEQLTTGKIKTR